MIIKKFQGKTEQEAVENAKKELGSNVVVMNVKNLKRTGLFGFFKPQLIEVTVALEEEREISITSAKKKEATVLVKQSELVQTKETALEEKIEQIQSILEKQFKKQEEISANDEKNRREKKEKAQRDEKLRDEKQEASSQADHYEESDTVRFMKLLYNTMIENEVNEHYANQIIDDLDKVTKPNTTIDYMLSSVYQKMILKFGKPRGISLAQNGPKFVYFIGPTGVGKTTTIAKLASKFCVEEKKKIALVTTDTYRIAAAEQLRTYANILEVPFRVIYSAEEMLLAYQDFSAFDYVLVDTAGHSHHNEAQRENMGIFLHALDKIVEKEVYLVVSATTKYRDLLSIAATYTQMTEFRIIFTKLDETTTLGNLLNLKLHTGAELSYITYGQNVPDDIDEFNPQTAVKELLTGKSEKI